jgi:hypothetical protein
LPSNIVVNQVTQKMKLSRMMTRNFQCWLLAGSPVHIHKRGINWTNKDEKEETKSSFVKNCLLKECTNTRATTTTALMMKKCT